MANTDRLEDRGQSGRPPNPRQIARNQGGRASSPSPRARNQVSPPPVARSRRDSVMRPLNEQRSTVGGVDASIAKEKRLGGQAEGAPSSMQAVELQGPPGADQDKGGKFGPESKRAANARESNRRGGPPEVSPPIERSQTGAPPGFEGSQYAAGEERQNARVEARKAARSGETLPPDQVEPGGPGSPGFGAPRVGPDGKPVLGQHGQETRDFSAYAPGEERQAARQALRAGSELPPPSQPPTSSEGPPGSGSPDQGRAPAGGPPVNPAPQDQSAIGGQAITPDGAPVSTPPAVPPQNDTESMGRMAGRQQEMIGDLSKGDATATLERMRSQGVGMAEQLLGHKWATSSERDPSPNAWQGEIGPGKPANRGGALGMPGVQNSPEDIQYNRTRFDQSLKQSKGDHYLAAQGTGSFPSGNPIAHGTMTHMKQLVETSGGDGVDAARMDEGTRRRYKKDAVRQMEEFGAYPGMDDPDSPTPPVRPLSWSYNAHTHKWVSPEGSESMIDRFGGSSQGGPN